MRGRPPKPTVLKALAGNPGKRPLNQNEPKPQTKRLTCPSWLDVDAKREWHRLSPELKRLGLLTIVDAVAFAGYCQAYARWMQAERLLSDLGLVMTVPTKNGDGYEQQRPEVSIAQKYFQIATTTGARFGLDPSSRSRLSVDAVPDDDAFAQLLSK